MAPDFHLPYHTNTIVSCTLATVEERWSPVHSYPATMHSQRQKKYAQQGTQAQGLGQTSLATPPRRLANMNIRDSSSQGSIFYGKL